jgi:hypothetical protein
MLRVLHHPPRLFIVFREFLYERYAIGGHPPRLIHLNFLDLVTVS